LTTESNGGEKKSVSNYVKPSGEYAVLLRVRERQKSKKPKFTQQESWRYKRLSSSWKRPKGLDSKMRLKKKGVPKSVEIGYRSPRLVRGFHPSGFEEKLVNSLKDLETVESNQLVRIGHTVGSRKRLKIVDKAKELGLRVLNNRGVDKIESTESKKTGV
jgi:large subunit ribosomal protein L32e